MQQDSGGGALEHIYKSIFLLASEVGRVEDRLALAYFKHIQLIDVSELPADAQPRFEHIRAELKKLYPVQGVVDGVDRNAVVNLAMEIILFYDEFHP